MWTRCKGCCSKPPGSPGPPRSHDSCGWPLGQAAGRKQVCSCSAETAMRSTAIPPFCTSAAGSSTQPAALPPQSAAAATGLRLPSLTGRLGPCSPITSASAAGGGATHHLPVSDGFSSLLPTPPQFGPHLVDNRPFFVRPLPDPHAQEIRTMRDNRRWTMKRILKWYRAAERAPGWRDAGARAGEGMHGEGRDFFR